ncbi:LysE family transporter [Pseudorhodoferax soli]|uniref:Threonine/homoserine/homoserine lactone efflux protein n=1 Tax=Pseudorhodoferax soli TaxID=545864 RepID=A0A368Y699_9BURK|nr:LysE family transporter [Pseudorhodoferax soli]RCW73734.1 threonine/homoserine/homoserine lactone efflux protein [Pseudorhodoferax soli]
MLDIQNYTSFVTAILVFQAVPGAGTIAILDATARQGRAAGMAAVLGTLLGDLVFMVGAALGLAALMQAQPAVFQGLQWFGAAYLCWLGVQLLRSPAGGAQARPAPAQPVAAHFRKALLVSLTNPKVLLFFVAFFPLFIQPGASAATLPVMMLHVTVLSLAYQAALVLVGNLLAVRLAAFAGARRTATRLAGVALIALGARLAGGVR